MLYIGLYIKAYTIFHSNKKKEIKGLKREGGRESAVGGVVSFSKRGWTAEQRERGEQLEAPSVTDYVCALKEDNSHRTALQFAQIA